MARPLGHNDYTVGWISALPIELAAARLMLDEQHDDLPQDDGDDNIYTLGRIGAHNVVLVCLPAGSIGINSTAMIAIQIKFTFPAIRFGFMVGIGGGVPSENIDIRLRDIVVSYPRETYRGIIQYDIGRLTPKGFKAIGFINNIP